ncbi:TetR/AcrR family transcriptional regulator [Pseudoruegeria sp. SK021]|uniref:TetR/AcrR family transcriptional regulator n=1 Tax=Pseudoruegeria sp. SK021 TaxID=1933035 RepID=UPI000A23A4E6|nr:TetR/AcrR family transcriptional regulator [Pseudoruegeria sp. SK021]OSP56787.1 TetR family transcriptional regulator [Pseudoruegeria sp. SK021]
MDQPIPQIKKGRKYDQVLSGAREVFLREGFEGATVDAIARSAGVSKATLYSYFPDKKLLFLEVAQAECCRQAETAIVLSMSGRSVEDTLREIAERMTGFFLSAFGQQVFRICVAEAHRFPEIGRTFYRSGPEQARNQLANYLQGAVARGELQIDDCRLAADQFAELCKADLFSRLIFNMTDDVSAAQITRVIDGAVQMFMARYGI